MLTGDNGILTRAGEAKERTSIAQEEEAANLSFTTVQMDLAQGKTVDTMAFQSIVDGNFGSGNATGTIGGNSYIITVKRTGINYQMDSNGNISTLSELPIDFEPGVLEKNGNTYIINSIEDLVALSYSVNNGTNLYENCVVQLGRNLNFEEDGSYADASAKYSKDSYGYTPDSSSETTIKEYMTNKSGSGFVPIGLGNYFKGEFAGNNNSLTNLYINSKNPAGLFFGNAGSVALKIENLSIISCDITSTSLAGALVGYGANLEISGCTANGNITSSSSLAGGFVGLCSSVSIEYSSFSGNVSGNVSGGLVGQSYGTASLFDCSNKSGTVTVIGNSSGGGLVGQASNISIYNCYNKANVEKTGTNNSSSYIGGVVGSGGGIISDCYNKGNITSENTSIPVGGIIGYGNNGIDIVNCFNSGLISSLGLAGGIVGFGPKSILNCYNFGSVTSTTSSSTNCLAGGISALGGSIEIRFCYNSGNVTVSSTSGTVGGITGTNATIKNCNNTGVITGGEYTTGYIVGNGSVDASNYYLKNSSSITKANGATEKTESEMNEIMDIQSFCDLMNDYGRETYGTNIGLWGIGSDGLPDFGLE